MNFEVFESAGLDAASLDLSEKMTALRSRFESSLKTQYDAFMKLPESFDNNIASWLGIDATVSTADPAAVRSASVDTITQMYNGTDLGNGNRTLGLKEIHNWKVNPEYYDQNMRQHAGYAAEVIGTAKENLQAQADGTGLTTYRADDRPDLFPRNDQYVDKIRVNCDGEIVERIQVKFVGKDPAECLRKLKSKPFDKYFDDGMVDRIEIPKDYYPEIKQMLPGEISKLEKQLQHVTENGNTEAAENLGKRIDRLHKIDEMLEKSTVSSDEALGSVKCPERITARLFSEDTFKESNKAGLESAALATTITAAVSTVDNVGKYMDGEITAQEAFVDVVTDTGIAGGVAYGTAFVSTAVANTMSSSSHQLIRSLGQSGVPAAVISFGVQSFDSIIDYADGIIDGKQLAFDLGENAAMIGGSVAGSAAAGAIVGSVVPGAGTAVGFAAGMVGGMVGCAVASEAYVSAVEFASEHVDELANKAQEMANKTVEIATEVIPDKVDNLISSINVFASTNNLPFRIG